MSSKVKRKTCRYAGLYKDRSRIPAAYRALLSSQYRAVCDNYQGALRGSKSVYLHDMRVALRRLRIILKFFKKSRAIRSEDKLDMLLKSLCSKLGKMRDLQSRLDLLKTTRAGRNVDVETYEKKCRRQLERGKPRMRKVLKGRDWKKCMAALRQLRKTGGLEEELDRHAGQFCAARISTAFKSFDSEDFVRPEDRDAVDLHALRKRIRKLRYKVEICAPVLGIRMKAMEKLCKKVTEALGRIHDVDMVVEMSLSKSGMNLPKKLMSELMAERKRMMKKLKALLREVRSGIKGREMKRHLASRRV